MFLIEIIKTEADILAVFSPDKIIDIFARKSCIRVERVHDKCVLIVFVHKLSEINLT